MQSSPKRNWILSLGVLALVGVGFIMRGSFQDKPKNEIRILIDRIPNTLGESQGTDTLPDTMAQRIVPLIKEFHYRIEKNEANEDFILIAPDPTLPKLHFEYVRDELSRASLFMGKRADVLYDTLSLAKTSWIQKKGVQVIAADGYTLSFLGFQSSDPVLKNLKVRQAIEFSLPLRDWAHYKFFDWVNLVEGVPTLPDLAKANHLLDEAGFPQDVAGVRFSLRYLTTPIREGFETALLVREALKSIGIQVQVMPIETSLFYTKLKSGDFQLFAGRMFRNSEKDPVSDFLGPKGVRNYFQYRSLPDRPFTFAEVKSQVLADLPILPLYTWKHAAVLSDRILSSANTESALDDSFRFLNTLRLK